MFDVIVVGAGSAGCVIAARLSEDPDRKVLLLEAGGTDRNVFCRMPGMVSVVHTVPQIKKRFDWGFKTAPRPETIHRKIPYVRGKVMGGSSAINGMIFVRGNRRNFDDWAADGCTGWSFEEVLPYFRRLESFEDGASGMRGGEGPIQVTRPGHVSPVSHAFRDAVAEVTGAPVLEDYNGESQEGVSLFQMSCKDGLRYSTSEAYIEPARARANLTVVSGAMAEKVMLEGTRAVGVRYRVGDRVEEARASEVVISAGAVGSPQLLMLSGIGPAAHLAEHRISTVADLPVGQNLHDHLFFPLTFLAPNAGHKGTPLHFLSGILTERLRGSSWFSRSVFEYVAFLKTSASEPIANLQLHSLPWAYPSPNQDKDERPKVDTRPALTVQPTLIYPKSRGEVLLRSTDPADKPHIDPHYLQEEADARTLMDGIALTREILRSSAIASEITAELHPGAAFFDLPSLRKELPNRVATVYHPVGTCRMGSDERSVVGPDLRVRGIEGLRVADASVMPTVTGGNTNAPSIMIGERCADLMRTSETRSGILIVALEIYGAHAASPGVASQVGELQGAVGPA